MTVAHMYQIWCHQGVGKTALVLKFVDETPKTDKFTTLGGRKKREFQQLFHMLPRCASI